MTDDIKPCVVCGKDWSDPNDLIDTVYPTHINPQTLEYDEWIVVCQLHNTGCGREVYGSSKEEALSRWNDSITDWN